MVRMSESVKLRPDTGGWQKTLSANERLVLWTLSGALMRRYGYGEGRAALG